MKIFGYEIRKYISPKEKIEECRKAFELYKGAYVYEWPEPANFLSRRNIPWRVCGRSGKWILIGSKSTNAKGCIKKPNWEVLDERYSVSDCFVFRFIRPEKLGTVYNHYPYR